MKGQGQGATALLDRNMSSRRGERCHRSANTDSFLLVSMKRQASTLMTGSHTLLGCCLLVDS